MKILNLTLKKKWYDMILSGEKKEEYREFKPYWIKRFGYLSEKEQESGYWNEEMKNLPDRIIFVNGYGFHRPSFEIDVLDWELGKSEHPEWGGDTKNIQFVFKLGSDITILVQ